MCSLLLVIKQNRHDYRGWFSESSLVKFWICKLVMHSIARKKPATVVSKLAWSNKGAMMCFCWTFPWRRWGEIIWAVIAVSQEQATFFCDSVYQTDLGFYCFCCHSCLPLLQREMKGMLYFLLLKRKSKTYLHLILFLTIT